MKQGALRNSVAPAILFLSALLLPLYSCSKPAPIKLGFLGGLSGRVADLGVAGRNGVMLAVEEANARGGIAGRQVELLVRDDEQNVEKARLAVADLLEQKVEAIIGPMTSSIAMAVVDQVNASSAVLISPTVTTTDLTGKDDNFLRVTSVTSDYAAKSANFAYRKLGNRKAAAIFDLNNKSYTQSWLNDFRKTFEGVGGKLVLEKSFSSAQEVAFGGLVKELLSAKPDLIVIITNAVDSASICQQIRKFDPKINVMMAEWASTERFIELAGSASEGVTVSQFLDRRDTSARYTAFARAYRERFGQDHGFAGLAGYDAALVALDALALKGPGDSLKKTILSKKTFQCAQQMITLDAFGDADRKTFVTRIVNGSYEPIE